MGNQYCCVSLKDLIKVTPLRNREGRKKAQYPVGIEPKTSRAFAPQACALRQCYRRCTWAPGRIKLRSKPFRYQHFLHRSFNEWPETWWPALKSSSKRPSTYRFGLLVILLGGKTCCGLFFWARKFKIRFRDALSIFSRSVDHTARVGAFENL